MIFLDYLQLSILSLFIGTNLWILATDIQYRKIPNVSLIVLMVILPFWIWAYSPIGISIDISHIILSIIIMIGWIFLYRDSLLLWSGDIKYASILVLFMGHQPISEFVGNVAILTLLCLILWILVILGYIYRYRWSLTSDVLIDEISPKIPKEEIYLYILAYILDFGIVGFIFSQLIPHIWVMLSYRVEMNENIYFLIFLMIYMIRPWSNYLITRWRYNIIPIFLIFIYFGWYIQNNGIATLYSEILAYVSSLWIYILLYIITRYISSTTYRIYDGIIPVWWREYFKTIPYSIVIFIAFVITYNLDINIINWIHAKF